VVLSVRAEQNAHDLDFVEQSLGKERSQRTICETRSEDFLFGRTSFALEVATGELARSGGFLAIINREREERLTFPHVGRHDGGYDDNGFAASYGDSSVGLFGQ